MSINFYKWNQISDEVRMRILRRSQADIEDVSKIVRPIIADVKARGDDALIDYAAKFDGASIAPGSIKASDEDFESAGEGLDEKLKSAIDHCAANVRRFHEEQMRRVEKPWMVEIEPGVEAGEQVNAIPSVGLYVPRGKGCFPSTVYMLALPAVIAGVEDIAIITPPTPDGGIDEATLYAAKTCGVRGVYKAGGAQGIAALAYGTESVPKVCKVLGPGSPYVQAAKQLLFTEIDPGMPASSSEAIVLADGSADPYNTCLDILNEAEHGKDSAVLLVTHDQGLADYVFENLPNVIAELPEPHRGICDFVTAGEKGYGGVVLTGSLEESIAVSNMYAPEHLHLKVNDADSVVPQLVHAGEILIGEYTPSSLGNYGIGVNHVLPTGGKAHSYSCTSVWDFLKRTSLSRVSKAGFEALKGDVEIMTDYEGFPAHGDVLRKRNF